MHAEEAPTVSVTELPTTPPGEGYTLLDVREDDEWAAGHAPGAVHIPLGELPARLDELAGLPEQPLYVVCRTGGRSGRAALWLNANGWDATNVGGGMKSWHTEGRPVVGDRAGVEPQIL